MSHKETLLSDYAPPDFLVKSVVLDIDIHPGAAEVHARLEIRRNPKSKNKNAPLFLNGENQKLTGVMLNGKTLGTGQYKLTPKGLTIPDMPDKAAVGIVSTHDPWKNTALSGLYASGPMLCTQCESEGFRRITYYPDRPDVMAKFHVTIHADRKQYPVLLSNGNLIASGKDKTRHWVTWDDPHPKPCYLFAMVAGKLDKVTSHFTTKSKRRVLIEIYVEPGRTKETGFALAALKKAMKWDEDTYGLEYDLDRFMLVSTPFFNAGAMENKGLNIFNDVCVLGRPETETDDTISFIERVVAHEYFHNWTGDRITCRDWFQISLKEGLTVFREQEFCSDMNSRAVERLDDVRVLRRAQFAEDAGAMAHPVRPDHYEAIDNFYTPTVYEKGSEVVRMIQTMVGRKGFRHGMDLYVKRHDGHAVTCDDFVEAMADANKIDLRQFMLWYSQAGTPVLNVSAHHDAKTKILRLRVDQSCPPTPGQPTKKPMHIPLAVGLLNSKGKDLIGTRVLSIKKAHEEFEFRGIKAKPVLSLLREFSAPVRLVYSVTDEELLFLLAHDSDPFNRWEAAHKLLTKTILAAVAGKSLSSAALKSQVAALGNVLRDKKLDAAFKAQVLALPSESELGLAMRAEGMTIDIDAIYAARKEMFRFVADALRADFGVWHRSLGGLDPFAADGVSMGKRSLKNLCLAYLAADGNRKILVEVFRQAVSAKNMTDRIAALGILSDTHEPMRAKALAAFARQWKKYPSIMDRWLSVQATARRSDVLKHVEKLLGHPAFDIKNPNRIRALIGAFAGNGLGFHAKDGSGYKFIADMILKLDPLNPHSTGGLAKSFARWRDYDPARQKLMQAQLRRLASHKKLSANVREVVGKSLRG